MELVTGTAIQAVTDPNKKTETDVMNIFRKSLTYDLQTRLQYLQNESMFTYWTQLTDKDYWDHRIELKFATRMCRTHASYVLKERPNIQVPPIAPDIPELVQHASYIERALNTWWDDEKITQKLKVWVLNAAVKGDFIWFLSVDEKKQTISFNNLQPDLFIFDKMSVDPFSPFRWVMRVDLINAEDLKLRFPAYKDLISPSGLNARFLSFTNFYRSDLYNLEKAVFFQLIDDKYIYTYINDFEVECKEHWYDFIPFYHFKYFDIGQKRWMSLMSFIRDPIKFLNQILWYQFDLALKVSNPPLVITGGNADISWDNLKWWKISIPQAWAVVQYLQAPTSNIALDKMAEIMRTFMHFLAWLNEEAMAGFTGALTSAGVSIELRMDSTVREALDVQIHLQELIQRMNRDYLKLMEKHFPKKDLFDSWEQGKIFDIKFPASMIGWFYRNIVDFWWILPKSNTEVVRNVLAKKQAGLISHDTALEEMRYMDPTIEKNKIKAETIAAAKLQQEIQAGWTVEQPFFENPKQEEAYIFEKEKMPLPHPAQNHEEHLKSHMAKYERVPHPLLLQHIIITQNVMKDAMAMSGMPARQPMQQPQWQWWYQPQWQPQ